MWIVGALIGIAASWLLLRPGSLGFEPALVQGIAAGALVGTAGSLAGYLLLASNRNASQQRFQVALFGGMLLRLGLFAVALVVVLVRGEVNIIGFLAGLIPAYLGFQAVEIGSIYRSLAAQRAKE